VWIERYLRDRAQYSVSLTPHGSHLFTCTLLLAS